MEAINSLNPAYLADTVYLNLMRKILSSGDYRVDRTGTGAYSLFGEQLRFDLSNGYFPLLTTKKVHLKSIIHELLWFLTGSTSIKPLNAAGVTIWDEWADKDGELGPVYGKQWVAWEDHNNFKVDEEGVIKCDTINQLKELVDGIKKSPYGRRHILSAWNVADVKLMALPPCHLLSQFFVSSDGKLSMQLYQRSADFFLGVPFNIASYALLLMMVAKVTGLTPGTFVHTFGDVHLYSNHIEQAKEQVSRVPYQSPSMKIADRDDLHAFTYEDFTLEGYTSHPAIKAPVAV